MVLSNYLLKPSIYPLSKGFPVFVVFCSDPRTPTFPFPHISFPIRICVCSLTIWFPIFNFPLIFTILFLVTILIPSQYTIPINKIQNPILSFLPFTFNLLKNPLTFFLDNLKHFVTSQLFLCHCLDNTLTDTFIFGCGLTNHRRRQKKD